MAKVKVSDVMVNVDSIREELNSVVNDVNKLFVNVNKCSIDNHGTNDRIDKFVNSTVIEINALKRRVAELEAKVTEALKNVTTVLEHMNTAIENNFDVKKNNSELDKYKKFDLNDFNQLKLFAGLIVSEVYKELEESSNNHIPQQNIDIAINFTVNYVIQAVNMSNKDILKSEDNLRIKEYLDNVKKYAKHAMSICLGQITHNAWYNNPYVNWNMGFNPYYKF